MPSRPSKRRCRPSSASATSGRATLPEAAADHGRRQEAGNQWAAADLGLDAAALAPRLTLEALFVPVTDTKVEIMEGDTPDEQAANLARRLKEAKLI